LWGGLAEGITRLSFAPANYATLALGSVEPMRTRLAEDVMMGFAALNAFCTLFFHKNSGLAE